MARAATYKGIAFPFKKSVLAFPAPATDDDLIKQALAQIILTGLGERVMRPEVGSKVMAFVFENNSLVLQETIRAEVMSTIARFESRVIVQSVNVEADDVSVIITINYIVIASRSEQSLTITIPVERGAP